MITNCIHDDAQEVVMHSVLEDGDEVKKELAQAVRSLTYTLSTELSSA